jgi:hypothetical protein
VGEQAAGDLARLGRFRVLPRRSREGCNEQRGLVGEQAAGDLARLGRFRVLPSLPAGVGRESGVLLGVLVT